MTVVNSNIQSSGINAVDLFAGAGGFTEGARQARVNVLWAANHSPLAVKYHSLNHHASDHVCQDLHQANWYEVPSHDILLASPCCQGHSPARGKDRPHHDAQRSTAWAVVSCAEVHRPKAVIVENVENFSRWVLYPAWLDAMSFLGYTASPHLLDAADHGVPQHRERLILVFTRSKAPLKLTLPKRSHVPVSSIIDWDGHRWSPIHKARRSPATLARIKAASDAGFGRRFVAPYYSNGSGKTGRSIERPLGVVTTRDRWAIIDLDRCAPGADQAGAMRMFQPPEYRLAMGFPANYHLPPTRREAIELLGNAIPPPMARDVIQEVIRLG